MTRGALAHSGAARLLHVLEREAREPRALREVLSELEDLPAGTPLLAEAIAELAEGERRRRLARTQAEWFRRLGWRLMRPLFALAVVAALAFLAQRIIAPALGFVLFASGAAALYAVIQAYVHAWSRDGEKLAAAEASASAARIAQICERLRAGADGDSRRS